MKLEAVKIQSNWIEFMSNIDTHISSPRKEKLVEFYEKYQERVILMPASHKKEYHSAFPGGYVDHVNRVVKAALSMSGVWESFGCDMTTFTTEELVFSAINHDLGKMGSEDRRIIYNPG
jgi:23S rRNA maturation-related 3'-5' exoribonuclease YhaM